MSATVEADRVSAAPGAVFVRNFVAAGLLAHLAFSALEYAGQYAGAVHGVQGVPGMRGGVGHVPGYLPELRVAGLCLAVLLCGPLTRLVAVRLRRGMSCPLALLATCAGARAAGVLARAACELLLAHP
jgi:hypothetical protein